MEGKKLMEEKLTKSQESSKYNHYFNETFAFRKKRGNWRKKEEPKGNGAKQYIEKWHGYNDR